MTETPPLMERRVVNLLLIEDDPADAEYVREVLSEEHIYDFQVTHAQSLSEGLNRLSQSQPDVILLDMMLPDSRDFQTMNRMLTHARHIPVVVLTCMSDEEMAVKSIQSGAQDFLIKGRADPQLLTRSILYAIQRFRLTNALHQSEERYRDIFDHTRDLILILSTDGHFQYVNPAWNRTLGYSPQETALLSMAQVLHSASRTTWSEIRAALLKGADAGLFELTLLSKAGNPVSVEGGARCTRKNGEPDSFTCMFHDVTERKHMEQLKDELVNTVSHEIRSPMTVIHGALEMLTEGRVGELSPKQKEYVEMAARHATSLRHFVDTFLDLSSLEFGKTKIVRRTVNMIDLVRQIAGGFETEFASRGISAEFDICESTPKAHADAEMMERVLTNLISNALRFAKQKIMFRVQPAKNFETGKDGVRMSVIDDGPGIPPERFGMLFQKFSKWSSRKNEGNHKGSGLGLAISKQIIGLHQGNIWAESSPGQGAAFHCWIPAAGQSEWAEFRMMFSDKVDQAFIHKKSMVLMVVSIANSAEILTKCGEEGMAILCGIMEERARNVLRATDIAHRLKHHIAILLETLPEGVELIKNRLFAKLAEPIDSEKLFGISPDYRIGAAAHGNNGVEPEALLKSALKSSTGLVFGMFDDMGT